MAFNSRQSLWLYSDTDESVVALDILWVGSLNAADHTHAMVRD